MNHNKSKKLTRALIMNALLLPGSGHFSIGARLQGAVMAGATLVFLIAPAIRFLTAFSIALAHEPPPGTSNTLGIVAAIGYAWQAHGSFILINLSAVLLLWAYGIADIAIRIRSDRKGK